MSVEKMIKEYNTVVADGEGQREFIKRYKAIRVGCANAMERLQKPSLKPKFQTASDGNYYAVLVGEDYLVVPRFELAFQESCFGPGAMGDVFSCPGYDSAQRYYNVLVKQAAIFSKEGKKWNFKKRDKGELNFAGTFTDTESQFEKGAEDPEEVDEKPKWLQDCVGATIDVAEKKAAEVAEEKTEAFVKGWLDSHAETIVKERLGEKAERAAIKYVADNPDKYREKGDKGDDGEKGDKGSSWPAILGGIIALGIAVLAFIIMLAVQPSPEEVAAKMDIGKVAKAIQSSSENNKTERDIVNLKNELKELKAQIWEQKKILATKITSSDGASGGDNNESELPDLEWE